MKEPGFSEGVWLFLYVVESKGSLVSKHTRQWREKSGGGEKEKKGEGREGGRRREMEYEYIRDYLFSSAFFPLWFLGN